MADNATILYQGAYPLADKVRAFIGDEGDQYIVYVNPVDDLWLEHFRALVPCAVLVDHELTGNVARVRRATNITEV